jgi:hypothetical protein
MYSYAPGVMVSHFNAVAKITRKYLCVKITVPAVAGIAVLVFTRR